MKVILDYNKNKNLCNINISDEDVYEKLKYHFSTPNEGKKFLPASQRHWIPDRINFINQSGYFSNGLSEMIIDWIKSNVFDRTVEWILTDSYKDRFKKDETNYEIVNDLSLNPRDYQAECVESALKNKTGTYILGTGAGKTFTIALLLNNLFHYNKIKKALILVPDNGLVTQFNDELVNQYKMKQKISLFYDKFNKIDKDSDIIIANRPLFLSRWEPNKKFFINEIDAIIVDEAHSMKKSNKIAKYIEKIPAIYRFGFTGTLAENMEDRFKCFGVLGPIRYQKSSKELRDEGVLSNVKVYVLNFDYENVTPKFSSYRDEIVFLQKYESRNRVLSKLCCSLKKNTLILVNYLEHGFELEQVFNEYSKNNGIEKKIYFIRGEIENSVREEIKALMEKEDDIICIAISKIFSTGINIKNIHNIVFSAGGKSFVTTIQAIGRGLRKHPDKKLLNIFDIKDNGYKYSCRHSDKRKEIYNLEKIPFEEKTVFVKS